MAARPPAPANAPAAAHALDILGVLSRRGEPVPAATIARALNLPRSSVYHLLSVLVDRGFVVHLPEERRYGLGVAAFELASAYQRQAGLERLARSTLDRLVDDTRHNAHLAILHGRDVVYVIEQRAPARPTLVTDVGVRLPATLTASGLAMLAELPAAQVRALFPGAAAFVQRDGLGPATPAALRTILQQTRQRGYALESGQITPGLSSVARAVLDHTGHPAAAVAVTFRDDAVDGAQHDQLVTAVGRAAAELTRRLRGTRVRTPGRA